MNFKGKSCSKIILVNVYPTDRPSEKKTIYAIVDDQSSRTLARSQFFNMFDMNTDSVTYTLSSCNGSVTLTGRCASNFTLEPVLEGNRIHLQSVIECDDIPNCREEIPTPDVARAYPHLADLATHIPELNDDADILLLIGRDHPDAHHVLTQRTGPHGAPFAQKLSLGWTVIGECCLDKVHVPTNIVTNKTHILPSGRSSTFPPCPSYIHVSKVADNPFCSEEIMTTDIFVKTPQDNEPGLSVNDREFLKIMDNECYRDENGNWTAPLPFKTSREKLPNNREQAMKRTLSFLASCKRNKLKMEHAISFMNKVFSKGHAEKAPELKDGEECWFLPIFGVYHAKKQNQIRMVFDSSAVFQGHSLNSALLSGPDLTNSLHGILLRFRKEKVAVTGDIEQMFHSFKIREDHRNFVRFIWFTDNDPALPLMEYRMCVNLFGNSPSPAVATYCLRQCVKIKECDPRVREFVNRNFYVDDGLASYQTKNEALEILQKTQTTHKEEGNLRFHKFASNSSYIMDVLPPGDRAKDLSDVNLHLNAAPLQRSLGLMWNVMSDAFTYQFVPRVRDPPLTKRGILSCLNSLYDPLGFISPLGYVKEGQSSHSLYILLEV
ncbi:uncharacterized protein LOC134261817 [Saccostrea cucullata]|uniref:uncharacterized protein LOC134261817 n=1 Tax=Saccostrea cuccullata TaxID=36930 RepID=UPI002ED1FA1D